jgi:pyridoxine 5-phosphate synthase
MIRLGVNVDHIATVRNARGERYPDPVQAAYMAQLGGADNITFHLREDRRHIKDRDVHAFKDTIALPLNFEMAATDEMISIAKKIKPHAVTLVPERRAELTTEGGLNVKACFDDLKPKIAALLDLGICVSLFIGHDSESIDLTAKLGAQAVEFHTGEFCHQIDKAVLTKDKYKIIAPFQKAAKEAKSLGLQVHFGHGLHYENAQWLQLVEEAEEANIGHAIVARALFVGMTEAVRQMKDLLNNKSHRP